MFNIFIVYTFVGMISTSSLLIGYYHGLLMRCIDVDLVRSKMWSSGLLSAHADDYISNCYSMHQKKCLLLEEVRHMNDNNVSAFCKLVEESCPYIGSQLTIGTFIDMHVMFNIKFIFLYSTAR